MDSAALLQVISKIPALKYRYLGCFDPNTFIFPMPIDTFQIVNTTTDVEGHWITLIRLSNGFHYFGDSLKATSLNQYPMLFTRLPEQKTTTTTTTLFLPLNTSIKQVDSLCGLYCIYFAWILFDNTPKVKELYRFAIPRFGNFLEKMFQR